MNSNRAITCSLMISTYNWPQALKLSLESALRQTRLPDEILIADDGSKSQTRELIEDFRKSTTVPIIHVWHEDQGFRLSGIRNKAISRASGDYIIQIDGDVIMEKHFIEDHLKMSNPDAFLCGSRVMLTERLSGRLLKTGLHSLRFLNLPPGSFLNSLRFRSLSKLLADRYKKNRIHSLRGCNMSFWRKDLLAINGYNESIEGWGAEDAEIATRLINAGVRKRFLKFSGIVFHIYHKENSRANAQQNKKILDEAVQSKKKWIPNGIIKENSYEE